MKAAELYFILIARNTIMSTVTVKSINIEIHSLCSLLAIEIANMHLFKFLIVFDIKLKTIALNTTGAFCLLVHRNC